MNTQKTIAPSNPPIIILDQLTKLFKPQKMSVWPWRSSNRPSPICALQDVTLSVNQGNILGLLGTNGAGKTTLLKILATLILPTSGRVIVNGHDVAKNQEHVQSIMGLSTSEERSFYWRLTGRQNLEFFAAFQGLNPQTTKKRIHELQKLLGLGALDRPFGVYSTGMRQHLGIARALLRQPQILLLDEPTRSLDPSAATELRRLVHDKIVAKMGCTVILTSHNLQEVEELCDQVAILHKGQLVDCGSLDELNRRNDNNDHTLTNIFKQLTTTCEAA